MALTLVLGPANAAKAGQVLGGYRLAAEGGALLVVPTSADAEHYDRELSADGPLLGRALTFPRLLGEVAARAGLTAQPLTQLQRQRLVRQTIASLDLPTLGDVASASGFSRSAARMISRLGRSRASAPRFAAALSSWAALHPERAEYARDLSAICLRYADALSSREVLDPEGFAWAALDALRAAPERWRGTPVFFYGFDDLTEIELDAITTLAMRAGAQVTVSLTFESDRPALAARAGVVEELRTIATEVRELPALDTYYDTSVRTPLHHLERQLFEPQATVLDPGAAVVLLEAGGERAEAEQVADAVAEALADGVEPGDLVVVCRSLTRSGLLLERALARRGVTTSSARRVPLTHTPLGRALRGLIRCATDPKRARASDLYAYLRAPGVVAAADELDALAARARRAGVTELGDALRVPGVGAVIGSALERFRQAPSPAVAIELAVRELFAAPLAGSAAILDAAERLDARAAATVLDALAQVSAIEETSDALLDLIEALDVHAGGDPGPEAVLVAEPLAIRARRFRRVFATGLCENEFPSGQAVADDAFLSDEDRYELAVTSGLVLGGEPDPLARERYLFYACVSRATDQVVLSYRSSDEDGNLVTPSPFLDDLERVLGADWRARRRRRLLGEISRGTVGETQERHDVAPPEPGGAPARSQPEQRVLSATALAHVRHTEIVSGNALETFAACPVAWLIDSQLRLPDLQPQPEAPARGSFIHEVLERVIAELPGPLTPATLPTALAAITERIAASEIDFAPGVHPDVKAAQLRSIEADLRRYVASEAGAGNGWNPAHTELRFGFDDEDDSGVPPLLIGTADEPVRVRGVIDRVDIEPDGRRAIVRDYKSGRLQPDWAAQRWQEGHKLQVALYMLAVKRLLGLEPVGGFYHPLSGPDLRPRGAYLEGAPVGEGTFANDARSATELDELLAEVEQQAAELAATLRRGELTPCPETCSGAAGGGCRHPGICWAAS